MDTSEKKIIEKVISGNSTPKDAREVVNWFSSSVEGQQYLSDMLDKDAFLLEEESDENYVPNKNQSARIQHAIERKIAKINFFKISLKIAAVLLPLILLAGITFYVNRQVDLFGTSEFAEVYVPKGEKARLFFHDGTEVFLNADSKIRYPKKFGLTKRKVYLEGEAYFQVSSNKKRPFIVNAGETSVKVLGTSFNVSAYKDNKEIRVVLDEGEIVFAARNNQYKLNPGQKFIYDTENNELYLMNVRNSDDESLWKSNYIRFNDTPLQETLKVLDRKFDVPFNVLDKQVLTYSFNLVSEDKSLSYILNELEKIAPVKFIEKNDTINVKYLK